MNLNLNLLNHTRIRISSPQFFVVVGACRLSSSAVSLSCLDTATATLGLMCLLNDHHPLIFSH